MGRAKKRTLEPASTCIQASPEDAKSRFTRKYDATEKKRKVTDNAIASASASAVKEELSEYELQRELNIERNKARLQVRKCDFILACVPLSRG